MVYCGGDGGDRWHVCMTCMHIVCLQLSSDVLYIAVHILACKARKSQSGGTMPSQRIAVVIIFGADASCKYLKCTALAEVSSRPPLCFRSSLIRAPASNTQHTSQSHAWMLEPYHVAMSCSFCIQERQQHPPCKQVGTPCQNLSQKGPARWCSWTARALGGEARAAFYKRHIR